MHACMHVMFRKFAIRKQAMSCSVQEGWFRSELSCIKRLVRGQEHCQRTVQRPVIKQYHYHVEAAWGMRACQARN